jgi:hypothetical protein
LALDVSVVESPTTRVTNQRNPRTRHAPLKFAEWHICRTSLCSVVRHAEVVHDAYYFFKRESPRTRPDRAVTMGFRMTKMATGARKKQIKSWFAIFASWGYVPKSIRAPATPAAIMFKLDHCFQGMRWKKRGNDQGTGPCYTARREGERLSDREGQRVGNQRDGAFDASLPRSFLLDPASLL